MSEREDFHDSEIAPVLLELGSKCEARGLSFLAVCEWQPGEYAETRTVQPDTSAALRLIYGAFQAAGNVDALWMGIRRDAELHGHNSVVLSLEGIPAKPDSEAN